MALLKKPTAAKKPIVLATNNPAAFDSWKDKTIGQIDEETTLLDIKVATSTNPKTGEQIESLAFEFDDRFVVFPFSRGIETARLMEDGYLVNLTCRRTKKYNPDGQDEPDNPTGPEYISFGLPSGIKFDKMESLVEAEPAVKPKP